MRGAQALRQWVWKCPPGSRAVPATLPPSGLLWSRVRLSCALWGSRQGIGSSLKKGMIWPRRLRSIMTPQVLRLKMLRKKPKR